MVTAPIESRDIGTRSNRYRRIREKRVFKFSINSNKRRDVIEVNNHVFEATNRMSIWLSLTTRRGAIDKTKKKLKLTKSYRVFKIERFLVQTKKVSIDKLETATSATLIKEGLSIKKGR